MAHELLQMSACMEKMDIVTETNNRLVIKYVALKERLVRRNGEKTALYRERKCKRKD